jgi:DNA-binding CsgD family transcriptional regulator
MNAPAGFAPPPSEWHRPTRGQLQVLELVAHGHSTAQAAGQLGISQSSVQDALRGVRGRLRARSDAHAVALAIAYGLLDPASIRLTSEAAVALGLVGTRP